MLVVLGQESIGDVYVTYEVTSAQEPIPPVSLEQADFTTLLEESINPSLKKDAADIGVPGVMPKLSASMITFPMRVKERRKEYILKLQPKEYPNFLKTKRSSRRWLKHVAS